MNAPANMSGIPAAFMLAFEEHKRLEFNDHVDIDSVEYQANANAFEGGFSRVLACGSGKDALDLNFIALKLCCAFDRISTTQIELQGRRIEDENLFGAMEGIRTAWRMIDAHGGDGVRPFARYVGIVEKSDEIGWEHDARRASVKEAA